MEQLLLYQKMGYQLNISNLQYKLYLLKTIGSALAKSKYMYISMKVLLFLFNNALLDSEHCAVL